MNLNIYLTESNKIKEEKIDFVLEMQKIRELNITLKEETNVYIKFIIKSYLDKIYIESVGVFKDNKEIFNLNSKYNLELSLNINLESLILVLKNLAIEIIKDLPESIKLFLNLSDF